MDFTGPAILMRPTTIGQLYGRRAQRGPQINRGGETISAEEVGTLSFPTLPVQNFRLASPCRTPAWRTHVRMCRDPAGAALVVR